MQIQKYKALLCCIQSTDVFVLFGLVGFGCHIVFVSDVLRQGTLIVKKQMKLGKKLENPPNIVHTGEKLAKGSQVGVLEICVILLTMSCQTESFLNSMKICLVPYLWPTGSPLFS